MEKHIYLFSGLGADERAFQKLDFKGYALTFVDWVKPKKKESMQEYARGLLAQIHTPKPILIGMSFGGMMAVEVAKLIEVEKLILIASCKNKYELPFYYRWAGSLQLHRIVPLAYFKNGNFLTSWFFSTKSSFDKRLLKQIQLDADTDFFVWAIREVILWKNTEAPADTIHIHGDKDRILPLAFVRPTHLVKGGGHLMTLTQYLQVNKILKEIL